jgi:hypothetical protein
MNRIDTGVFHFEGVTTSGALFIADPEIAAI